VGRTTGSLLSCLSKKSITQVELPDENDGMKELTRIMSLLGTKRTNGTALGLSKPCPTLLGRMESLSRSSTPLSTLPSSAQIYTPSHCQARLERRPTSLLPPGFSSSGTCALHPCGVRSTCSPPQAPHPYPPPRHGHLSVLSSRQEDNHR